MQNLESALSVEVLRDAADQLYLNHRHLPNGILNQSHLENIIQGVFISGDNPQHYLYDNSWMVTL